MPWDTFHSVLERLGKPVRGDSTYPLVRRGLMTRRSHITNCRCAQKLVFYLLFTKSRRFLSTWDVSSCKEYCFCVYAFFRQPSNHTELIYLFFLCCYVNFKKDELFRKEQNVLVIFLDRHLWKKKVRHSFVFLKKNGSLW